MDFKVRPYIYGDYPSYKYFALIVLGANKWVRLSRFQILDPDGNVVDGKVEKYTTDIEIPSNLGHFYFNNNGRIDKNSLEWEPLQSSILLKWKLEDPTQAIDRYEIRRCETGKTDTITINSNVTQMEYEDKDVSPTRTYI